MGPCPRLHAQPRGTLRTAGLFLPPAETAAAHHSQSLKTDVPIRNVIDLRYIEKPPLGRRSHRQDAERPHAMTLNQSPSPHGSSSATLEGVTDDSWRALRTQVQPISEPRCLNRSSSTQVRRDAAPRWRRLPNGRYVLCPVALCRQGRRSRSKRTTKISKLLRVIGILHLSLSARLTRHALSPGSRRRAIPLKRISRAVRYVALRVLPPASSEYIARAGPIDLRQRRPAAEPGSAPRQRSRSRAHLRYGTRVRAPASPRDLPHTAAAAQPRARAGRELAT